MVVQVKPVTIPSQETLQGMVYTVKGAISIVTVLSYSGEVVVDRYCGPPKCTKAVEVSSILSLDVVS